MSLVVLGLAGELRPIGIARQRDVAAHDHRDRGDQEPLGGDEIMRRSRSPDILADAAHRIFQKPASFTGNFLIE